MTNTPDTAAVQERLDQRRILLARDEAHRRTERDTVRLVKEAIGHIDDRNYGFAADLLGRLLEDLVHDHGAQDITPMFDRHLEELL